MIYMEDRTIDNTFMREFKDEIFVDVDNVARWVFREAKDGEHDYGRWYEAIVPPIDNSIFTYKFYSGEYGAVIVSKIDLLSGDKKEIDKLSDYLSSTNEEILSSPGLKLLLTDTSGEARWLVAFTVFVAKKYSMDEATFVGQITMLVAPGGGRIGDATGSYISSHVLDEKVALCDTEIGEYLAAEIQPVIVAISLMHCKNVELVNRPIARPERRRAKKSGEPVTQFKVLNIEPFKKKVINEAAGTGQSGLKLAMHICRGHFREYSEERPLFGKYAGKFWIPQHAKGSRSEGVVEKDYKVDV